MSMFERAELRTASDRQRVINNLRPNPYKHSLAWTAVRRKRHFSFANSLLVHLKYFVNGHLQ